MSKAGKVRVLGIDPGTRVAGWGVVEAEGTRLRFVACGALRAPRGAPVEKRLAVLATGLREVLDRWTPGAAAMEDVFVKADPKAALTVGEGRGALLAVLGERGFEVASYPPARVKRSVTGHGAADKLRVARMVATLLGLERPPEPADATDALAVALTHALASKSQLLQGQ